MIRRGGGTGGTGGRRGERRPPGGTATVAVTLLRAVVPRLLWFLLFADSGGDPAAQDAWAEFAGGHPGSAYDPAWYGACAPCPGAAEPADRSASSA